MFENIIKFFKKIAKKDKNVAAANSKDTAKERLHLVLMQDRANVSADFLELMKQEIIEVIKKYIDVDESAIDVRLTNKENEDGTNGAPALYANIPILNIKNEIRKTENKQQEPETEKEENKKTKTNKTKEIKKDEPEIIIDNSKSKKAVENNMQNKDGNDNVKQNKNAEDSKKQVETDISNEKENKPNSKEEDNTEKIEEKQDSEDKTKNQEQNGKEKSNKTNEEIVVDNVVNK